MKIFFKNVAYQTHIKYQINIDDVAIILIWSCIQNFNFYVLRFHFAWVLKLRNM